MKNLNFLFFCIFLLSQVTFGQVKTKSTAVDFEKKADTLYSTFIKYDSAAVYYYKAAKLNEQLFDWLSCVKDYRLTSISLTKAAKFDTALFYAQKAFNISEIYFKESNKDEMFEKSDVLLSLGDLSDRKGKIQEELTYYKNALELVLKTDSTDELRIAKLWNRTGYTYSNLGKYDSALLFCEKALKARIRLFGDNNIEVSESYITTGKIYYVYQRENKKALEYYQKALKIRISILGELHPNVATIYTYIGIVLEEQGEYDKALIYFEKACKIYISTLGELHISLAQCYNNIGAVYTYLGNYEKALEYYQKSLQIKITILGIKHPDIAATFNNIGFIYYTNRDNEKALEYYQKSIEIQIPAYGDDQPELAATYRNIGLIFHSKGEFDTALEYLQKSLKIEISVYGKYHPNIAICYYILGSIYCSKGEYFKALGCNQKALVANLIEFNDTNIYNIPKIKNVLSERILKETLIEKADIFYKLFKNNNNSIREIEASMANYEMAFELINKMRNELNFETTKLLLSENTKNYYADAAEVALEYDKVNPSNKNALKAFEFIERGKGATLSAQFNDLKAKHIALIPDSLLEKENELKTKQNFYNTKINIEKFKQGGYDTVKVNLFENKYFTYSRQYDSLIEYFETKYPEYYDLKYSFKTITIEETQRLLDNKTAIINYFIGDTILLIAVITKNAFEIRKLSIDSTFKESVTDYFRSMKMVESNRFYSLSFELYRKLIYPVKDLVTEQEKLIIIPDDYLYYVPFETLIQDSINNIKPGNDPNYLINNYSISYHNSVSLWSNSLKLSNSRQSISNDFIGFAPVFNNGFRNGFILESNINILDSTDNNLASRSVSIDGKKFNPLPYTEKELSSIIKDFEKNRKKATGFFNDKATEENFKKNIKTAKYIHIASHGFANDKNPSLSAIAFSQPAKRTNNKDSIEDGILYSGEIYNLKLNADLVVLSACETGIGKMVKGEGMLSMTRGFLYAGVPNIIYSLWRVPDKNTKELMVELYDKILEGNDYTTALRKAKIKILNNSSTSFPIHWAGFVLLGK